MTLESVYALTRKCGILFTKTVYARTTRWMMVTVVVMTQTNHVLKVMSAGTGNVYRNVLNVN